MSPLDTAGQQALVKELNHGALYIQRQVKGGEKARRGGNERRWRRIAVDADLS